MFFAHNTIFLFSQKALASLEKFALHTIRVSQKYDFAYKDNGDLDWYPKWTYSNSLLFTMTTLTLIGKSLPILQSRRTCQFGIYVKVTASFVIRIRTHCGLRSFICPLLRNDRPPDHDGIFGQHWRVDGQCLEIYL